MTEEQRKTLESMLWNIANTLRGKMHADEFRDYILGFIFYKYLSEKMEIFADGVLTADSINYADVNTGTAEGKKILEAIKEASLESLGYFLAPSELFRVLAARSANREFILEDLAKVLSAIERSTSGAESAEDFDHLFEDIDLTSTKLGKTESAKNELISKVLVHLDGIDFRLEDADSDILGDAYEYLISQFASGAGKKAGEFYTPQAVSTILARIVTTGKKRLKNAYDPTCGSGSLLLRVAKETTEVGDFFGQELNRTTYNLARMNMILHGVRYQDFDIKQDDTLEHPMHLDMQFEAIVANPPFSAKWSAKELFLSDDRFSQYGKLAPASKADYAFVTHMLHHLSDNGTMAVVLPYGALFRGAAEGHIREFIIKNKNWLDAVIGLPADIFYGTSLQACIMVFKKCRESDQVLFIDATKCFEKGKNKNFLRKSDIEKIVSAYRDRTTEEKFSHLASVEDIEKNNYKLYIPHYIDASEESEEINISDLLKKSKIINDISKSIDDSIRDFSKSLGIEPPICSNLYVLEQFKSGLMDRIFSQKLRFKQADGTSYPDWDFVQFEEVFSRVKRKNQEDNQNVLTISSKYGLVSQTDFFNKSVAANDLRGYYLLEKGDFAYNKSYSKGYPMGAIKRLNKYEKGVVSTLYICFVAKDKEFSDFFEQYFESGFMNADLSVIAQEGARNHGLLNVSVSDFFEQIAVPLPHTDEQRKIADALSALDAKIELVRSHGDQIEAFSRAQGSL